MLRVLVLVAVLAFSVGANAQTIGAGLRAVVSAYTGDPVLDATKLRHVYAYQTGQLPKADLTRRDSLFECYDLQWTQIAPLPFSRCVRIGAGVPSVSFARSQQAE